MKSFFFLICLSFVLYSCSPINKQHGYLLEDMVTSVDDVTEFNIGSTTENDILTALGSPSIKIDDINNIWIYLVSIKEQNVFESDNIIFQSISRFEFDNEGILLSKNFYEEDDYTQITFSQDKTRIISDDYGIVEQIYESFTRTPLK